MIELAETMAALGPRAVKLVLFAGLPKNRHSKVTIKQKKAVPAGEQVEEEEGKEPGAEGEREEEDDESDNSEASALPDVGSTTRFRQTMHAKLAQLSQEQADTVQAIHEAHGQGVGQQFTVPFTLLFSSAILGRYTTEALVVLPAKERGGVGWGGVGWGGVGWGGVGRGGAPSLLSLQDPTWLTEAANCCLLQGCKAVQRDSEVMAFSKAAARTSRSEKKGRGARGESVRGVLLQSPKP